MTEVNIVVLEKALLAQKTKPGAIHTLCKANLGFEAKTRAKLNGNLCIVCQIDGAADAGG